MIGKRLAHYEITAHIGTGGMGAVYRARDTQLDRDVAIKVLPDQLAHDTERVTRFRREAKLLASLSHPNIAQMYGLHTEGDLHFLAMEFVDGEDLQQRLERGPVPLDDALHLALQLTRALDAAHAQGIVHRDLKPANIVVDAQGTLKVLDFGLAKATVPDANSSDIDPSLSPTVTSAGTMAGMVMGTAAYMSPEQARGRATDARCDIWAFGAVLMELLTGRQVFAGETVSDIIAAVIKSEPDWKLLPDDTPRAIRRLLRRCLRKDPRQRMRHADSARLEIEDALAEPDPVELARKAAPGRPPNRLLPWVVAAVAVVIAVVLGVRALRTPTPLGNSSISYRFDVPWHGFGYVPQVSPDGRLYTHLELDPETRESTIWIRSFDGSEARALRDTDIRGRDLFWTRDSASLMYFTDTSLKRINIDGGAPQMLCDVPNGAHHISEAADGTILVEVSWNTEAMGWYLLTPGSRAMTPYERPFEVESGQTSTFPTFFQDGDQFVVTNLIDHVRTAYLGRLGSSEITELFESDTRVFPADGWYVYALRGKLLARRFDADSKLPLGDPRVLAERVDLFAPTGSIELSVSQQGTLLYETGEHSSELVWFDPNGKELEQFLESPDLRSADISPDGRRIVLIKIDSRSGTGDLWTHDLQRGIETQLTETPWAEFSPVWSPDGQRIAYSADPAGPPNLFLLDATSGTPLELIPPDQRLHYPTGWTPDGQEILFERISVERFSNDTVDLWIINAAGGEPRILLEAPDMETDGTLSPDGRWLAYTRRRSGRPNIWLHVLDNSQPDVQVSVEAGWGPTWVGGDRLLYEAPQQRVMSVSLDFSGERVEVDEPQVLIDLQQLDGREQDLDGYSVHPDGRILVLRQFGDPDDRVAKVIVGWEE